MEERAYILVKDLIDDFNLEVIIAPDGFENKRIYSSDMMRPGLQLAGYFDHFDPGRVQIFGRVEMSYLEKLSAQERSKALEAYFQKELSVVVIARNLPVFTEMAPLAHKYNTPILRTSAKTSQFVSELVYYLNRRLSKVISCHGVLVEVYGEGVLFMGESGVGKSETAIELIKRGHILIADDAVLIRKISDREILGMAPDLIKHLMEIRGIGIIDIKNLFGIGAVKDSTVIDLVINLETWDDNKYYDRLGTDGEYSQFFDVKIPSVTIPVKPGRNLAVIIETAAMNNRQKRMGYNALDELDQRMKQQELKERIDKAKGM
ncbi:MAG: HPr(Ser) kinase/phosphatase [Clostridia bacterium]|nr:HPr(Ser) kinase/phosphatase [Clostridia bacterium]